MRGGMSLRIIISILLAISIFSPPMSAALTTFGKTNPQNQNQNPTPSPTSVGKARECKTDQDCIGIQNTMCLPATESGRTRCLCSDYSAPVNGACLNKFKALHMSCKDDTECIDDAHCVQHNTTLGKRCYCQDEFYEESFMLCSVGKAPECTMDSDCFGIQNTTCLRDFQERRNRCLCSNYSAPVNGACPNKF